MQPYKIQEVQTKKDLKKFVDLPWQLHKTDPKWVPPIYMDEFDYFNSEKNPQWNDFDRILLLCYDSLDRVCGRVMGLVAKNEPEVLRFSLLECKNEEEFIANSLIDTLMNWGKGRGLKEMVGPLALSDKDPQGYLIEGFEHTPVIATNYNTPDRITLLYSLGFEKKIDLFVYRLNVRNKLPELYHKIIQRVHRNNSELRLLKLKSRWQLKKWIVPVFKLVNLTFTEIYAFSPLSEKEMKSLSFKYLPVLNPKFLKIIVNNENEVIAFVLAMPNMTEGLRRSKGKMLPFGIFKVWHSQRKTKQLDMLLGAVHPKYQNRGLDAVLAKALFSEAKKAGFEFIDSHLELETNTKMHAENEKLGGQKYKTYRIFRRSISN